MRYTDLVIELVVTGLLTLVALFLPAVADGWLELELSAESVSLGIVLGFVLGVVIDRCTDSILARWEGYARCRFAFEEVADQRSQLVKRYGGGRPVTDPFPEDWMRLRIMTKGPEPVLRWMDLLRTRIRIARTVAMLTPAVTTSAVLAIWTATDGRDQRLASMLPGLNLLVLTSLFLLADLKVFRTPRTTEVTERPERWLYSCWLGLSPAMVWLALQLAAAALLIGFAPARARWPMAGALALGTALTFLAIGTWLRITATFNRFLWDYWRFELPGNLAEACVDEGNRPRRVRPAAPRLCEQLLAGAKFLRSFGKSKWELDDYPLRVTFHGIPIEAVPRRLRIQPWTVQIINWWLMRGAGESEAEARSNLLESFRAYRATHARLPRPGTRAEPEIEFAARDQVDRLREIVDDVVQRVIGLEAGSYLVSDESSLWDFHSEDTNEAYIRKIALLFNVDVSDLDPPTLVAIAQRIREARG